MNKLENWMDNLKEPALKQALRFILEPIGNENTIDNIVFIERQIKEFNKMYPKGE